MRYVAKCPWCYEPMQVDDQRLDGGARAMAHGSKCPWMPKSTKRNVDAPGEAVETP